MVYALTTDMSIHTHAHVYKCTHTQLLHHPTLLFHSVKLGRFYLKSCFILLNGCIVFHWMDKPQFISLTPCRQIFKLFLVFCHYNNVSVRNYAHK
jgi:hypothetical protein